MVVSIGSVSGGSGGPAGVVPWEGNIEVISGTVAQLLSFPTLWQWLGRPGPSTLCVMPLPHVVQSSCAGVPDWP